MGLSVDGLFRLKLQLETQLTHDFVEGASALTDGAFDFLIGEWHLARTSFDKDGNVASESTGTAAAHYVLGGRAIYEQFENLDLNGQPFRSGIALYTFRPSTGEWYVAAVDASTGATSYQPACVNNEIHYASVVDVQENRIYTKSRIFNISDRSTEWEQRVSLDGKHWMPNYHIVSTRKSPQ